LKTNLKNKKPQAETLGVGRNQTMSITHNINIRNGEIKVKGETEQSLIFQNLFQTLKKHLKNKIYLLCVSENGDKLGIFQALKRGDKKYGEFLKKRFKEINRTLKSKISISGNKTNAIFLTLTIAENSVDSVLKGVQRFKPYLDKIRRKLKRLGYTFGYVWVREFQKRGSLHYHLILVLNRPFRFRKDREKGKAFILSEKLYNQLFEIFNTWELGFVNLEPVSSVNQCSSYLSKYIVKGLGEIESELENLNLGDLGEFELDIFPEPLIKKIWGFGYALKFRFRLWGISQNLKQKLDIIYTYNNSDKVWGIEKGFKLVKRFKSFEKLFEYLFLNFGIVISLQQLDSGALIIDLFFEKNQKN
jgi:hypothetical protein